MQLVYSRFIYIIKNIDGNDIFNLVWSPDGKWIAINHLYSIVLWDVNAQKIVKTIPLILTDDPFPNYRVNVIDMDWHPDNRRLAITGTPEGGPIGFIMILDIETETILDTYVYSDGEIMGILKFKLES